MQSTDNEADDAFMRRAIELSARSMDEGTGPPFGAVVVRGGHVVAEGQNLVHASNDPTAHAEIVAIRRACEALGNYALEGCTIDSSSEPCPMCLSAIYWAGMERIVYANDRAAAAAAGFDDERLYREVALPVADRAMPMAQRLAQEAKAVFDTRQARQG